MALNVCLTERRRSKPFVPLEFLSLLESTPGPEAAFLRSERQQRARDEIERLRPAYREAVLLRLIAEWTYKEMAETLGVSVNTARLRVSRGMSQLRKRLGPWLKEEGD